MIQCKLFNFSKHWNTVYSRYSVHSLWCFENVVYLIRVYTKQLNTFLSKLIDWSIWICLSRITITDLTEFTLRVFAGNKTKEGEKLTTGVHTFTKEGTRTVRTSRLCIDWQYTRFWALMEWRGNTTGLYSHKVPTHTWKPSMFSLT